MDELEVLSDVNIENRIPGKIIFMTDGFPVVVCGKGLARILKMRKQDQDEVSFPSKFRTRFK